MLTEKQFICSYIVYSNIWNPYCKQYFNEYALLEQKNILLWLCFIKMQGLWGEIIAFG